MPGWKQILSAGLGAGLLIGAGTGTDARALPSVQAVSSGSRLHATPAIPLRCPKRNVATGSIAIANSFGSLDSVGVFPGTITQSTPFEVDARGRLFPEMATVVPTIKNGGLRDGGKTYVIHLKHGMRWSNGAEITSADARFGWRVMYDPRLAPCDACYVRRLDTPDRYTIVYHLDRVFSSFLWNGIPFFVPVQWPGGWKRNDINGVTLKFRDPSWNGLGPQYPTDGPYQVARVTVDHIDFRPMKYYNVMSCGAFIKQIRSRFFTSKLSLLAAATARRVDLAEGWTLADLPDLQNRIRNPVRLHVDPSMQIEQVELNVDAGYHNAPNPLHDARVRQALALALDKRALIANVLGLNPHRVSNVIQWAFCADSPKYRTACADRSITGQWDPISHRYDPNPGRGTALLDAKKLFAQTRWRTGFTLDVVTTENVPIRQAEVESLVASWRRLGVRLNATYYPPEILFGSWDGGGVTAHGQFQVQIVSQVGSGLYPDTIWPHALASDAIDRDSTVHSSGFPNPRGNTSGIRNSIIDKGLNAAARTVDPKVVIRQYRIIQEEMARKDFWIELYARGQISTEDQRIANLSDSVEGTGLYWNSWAWRVK